METGHISKQSEREVTEEILLLLRNLDGITSVLKSDHILNLFEEVQGRFPDDKEDMISALTRFLALPPQEQILYQTGRRAGVFRRLDDLLDSDARARAERCCTRLGITPENLDETLDELMKRFI